MFYQTLSEWRFTMKYVVVIGDGMADIPIKKLAGHTVLQSADIPNMDLIASKGVNGMLSTVPENMTPGSDVANLSIMGYNPEKYYTGRGPLEAPSIGAKLEDGEVAFRCNFITEESNYMNDFNAGHISTFESAKLIEALNHKFSSYGKFYLGTSYRHLFVYENIESSTLQSTPPHDMVGESIDENLLKPFNDDNAMLLNKIMEDSKIVLKNHPVNVKRVADGKKPANMIWLWGQGIKPTIPQFKDVYGLKGATITGVDLLKGLGYYLGLTNVEVQGATGYYDTDYDGKAKGAINALENHDLVFVHVEAPDEAGHAGDLEEKLTAVERIDKKILGKLLDELPFFDNFAVAITPDHPTPLKIRTHTSDPVPYAMYSTEGKIIDEVSRYDEFSARNGIMGLCKGYEFIKNFLKYSIQ